MTPLRINVLGASGAGVSTLGRSLAAILALPYFDSDDYFHAPSDPPYLVPRAPGERLALVRRDLRPAASWVLGGGVVGWDPEPDLDFTLVVFVRTPTEVRLERLRRREAARFGSRILPGGDMHRQHQDFLRWAARYDAGDVDGKTLGRHRAWLAQRTCPVLEVPGTGNVPEVTGSVLRAADLSG